jgi:hypothetical protein
LAWPYLVEAFEAVNLRSEAVRLTDEELMVCGVDTGCGGASPAAAAAAAPAAAPTVRAAAAATPLGSVLGQHGVLRGCQCVRPVGARVHDARVGGGGGAVAARPPQLHLNPQPRVALDRQLVAHRAPGAYTRSLFSST